MSADKGLASENFPISLSRSERALPRERFSQSELKTTTEAENPHTSISNNPSSHREIGGPLY